MNAEAAVATKAIQASFASIANNIILNTDSYKPSHFLQYPKGTDGMFAYIESRGGAYDSTVFFGLQYILKEYLSKPVTMEMVAEAKAFFAVHGEPFDEAGWTRIVERFGGFLPVKIRAVPEGSVIPNRNILVSIESTDPETFWVVSFIETLILRVWYPTTVATISWNVRKLIMKFLERTSMDPAGQISFKLHDFGARGVSSLESAAIGGAAHLVNFMGSDTVAGVLMANRFYNEPMAGFSIPAAEHSTITSWGKENEVDAYRNMLRQFAKPGSLVAVVSDSYDIYNAVGNIWGKQLRQEVIDSGATLVIRPDSGEPIEVVTKVVKLLDKTFGSTVNAKGFRVLNHVRVIQGDGVNPESIKSILTALAINRYSAENIAFGMGGGLLQQLNRDTMKFAMKASAVRINGEWRDIFKDPITDPGKTSKKGRLSLFRTSVGKFETLPVDNRPADAEEVLGDVWKDGVLLKEFTFAEVRGRATVV